MYVRERDQNTTKNGAGAGSTFTWQNLTYDLNWIILANFEREKGKMKEMVLWGAKTKPNQRFAYLQNPFKECRHWSRHRSKCGCTAPSRLGIANAQQRKGSSEANPSLAALACGGNTMCNGNDGIRRSNLPFQTTPAKTAAPKSTSPCSSNNRVVDYHCCLVPVTLESDISSRRFIATRGILCTGGSALKFQIRNSGSKVPIADRIIHTWEQKINDWSSTRVPLR
jgi:hypothetical protein